MQHLSDEISKYAMSLRKKFEACCDPEIALGAKAYMRNISEFYGIPAPRRRQILQEFKKETGFPGQSDINAFVRYAWSQPQREWQYAAMEMTAPMARKGDFSLMGTAEFMIVNKSWWDTVDYIASNVAGPLFRKNQEKIRPQISQWLETDNHWLWRTGLLFQLKYGCSTDRELLFSLCEQLSAEQDFFIRKAIGWALRQYSKTNPDEVIRFVNTTPLSALSMKEAMKVIQKAK